MASFHNKHIPTQWGVAIVGFLLVTVALLIPVLSQQQNLKSEAYRPKESGGGYTQDASCVAAGGTCNSVSQNGCAGGSYVSGKCPSSGSDIKCCIKSAPKDYGQGNGSCAALGGTCNSRSLTGCSVGSYVSNKCPGPDDWKCCVPSAGGSSPSCASNGGFCAPNSACGAEGGQSIGKYDCGTNICCKEKTSNPTSTLAPKPTTPPTLAPTAKPTKASLSFSEGYFTKRPGETAVIYVRLNPKDSNISGLKFTIKYDPKKFSYGKFEINSGMFPGIKNQNSPTPGVINVELAIGSDPTKAITSQKAGSSVHVGTLSLKAAAELGSTSISFSNAQAFSLAQQSANVDLSIGILYATIY